MKDGLQKVRRALLGLKLMARDLKQLGPQSTKRSFEKEVLLCGSEDVTPAQLGEVDFVFTSPPYFDVERYSYHAAQSCLKFPAFNDWVDHFLKPSLQTAYDSLRDDGYCVYNVKVRLARKRALLF